MVTEAAQLVKETRHTCTHAQTHTHHTRTHTHISTYTPHTDEWDRERIK